jgi:rRNA maturation endonuclease Nob1
MTEKLVTGECENCDSTFELTYAEELVSDETPNFCPFCGERIEDIQEEYIEEDELDENEEWD